MAERSEQGDMSAAELFREHGAFVARFLFRLGVPADAIQDTVQEVFLVVHQRGGYRRGPAKPTSYLAAIAVNAASAQRRKARAQASRLASTEPDELLAREQDPELTLQTHDSLVRLQRALDKLEPELRATLLLADAEEETCASIGQAMGVPVGTVYWRLHEARKKFQRALVGVDAALERPRAARERGASPAPVFARSARMLTMAMGWFAPAWRGSEAQELLRATAKEMPFSYDVPSELARHLDRVARLPSGSGSAASVAPQAAPGLLGSMAGTKVAIVLTMSGAALLAALQLLPSRAEPPPAAELAEPSAATAAENVPSALPLQVSPDATEPASEEVTQGAARVQREGSRRGDNAASPTTSGALVVSSPRVGSRVGRTEARSTESRARSTERTANTQSEAAQETPAEPRKQAPAEPAEASVPAIDEVLEAQALGRAESLLRSNPAQALAIVRKVATHGRSDYLTEERRYIEVMALYALGSQPEAERAADAFLSAYPQSVFGERVRRARR
ncbi:MAG: sigma-70 family RNA polymerase sigma factor [Myxococcales bacterium]